MQNLILHSPFPFLGVLECANGIENIARSRYSCDGHEEKIILAFPILKTSAKSVQTTAEVCADYTCSLYRLQLKSPESTTYLQI